MKPQARLFLLPLLAGLLLLIACNREGVGGFAPGGDRVAIVRDEIRLLTTNADGANAAFISQSLDPAFGTTFSPDGSEILYMDTAAGGICRAPAAGGGTPDCAALELGDIAGGVLSFLPNGDVLLATQQRGNNRYRMTVFNRGWQAVRDETNIDHFFVTASAFQEKRGEDGREWYLRPHAEGIRWVITRGQDAYAFAVTPNGIAGPEQLAVRLRSGIRRGFEDRDIRDISSGVLSPDGQTIALRTGDEDDGYSLYVLDLTNANGTLVELVEDVGFRVQFAFSPDGSEIAYESDEDGGSVWIASADGSNQRQLAVNASLPEWH
jgi:hypothetical protein